MPRPRKSGSELEAARKAGLQRQGSYLRRLRDRVGLTQGDLAKVLNVTAATVQHWEKGRYPVGLEHQTRMAELLNVSLASFVLRLCLFANPLLAQAIGRGAAKPPTGQCCRA